ncbi:MAG: PEP/pyruvate-binding domain-containing protein, partial [Planctomycetota bacterium]
MPSAAVAAGVVTVSTALPERSGRVATVDRRRAQAKQLQCLFNIAEILVRQDRLGLFAIALDRKNISLVEILDIVNRFCREMREGEAALSQTDDLNVRLALTRRFLTDNLATLRVAKKFLTMHEFGRLLQRVVGPAQGYGRLGGKACGLLLAAQIVKKAGATNPLLEKVRIPHTWYVTSDGLSDFVRYNALEDLQSFKFSSHDEIRHSFPYIEQIFKHSFFSLDMLNQVRIAFEDMGDGPLIVRSSSLLED